MASLGASEHGKRGTRARLTPPSHPQSSYCRSRDLARLLPLWPAEIADESEAGRRAVVALLRRALRAERQRGLGGHWTYDLARHAQLLTAYRAECAALHKGSAP